MSVIGLDTLYSLFLPMEDNFMSQPIELTLEQKFNLRSFQDQVQIMSPDQAKEMLMYLYEHMLVKDTMYKQVLKHEWGLEPNA
jgi:Phycobilisome degradation protein nblA